MTVKHLFPAVEPSLNLDFANSKKLDPRITFTRSSTGTYVDSNGVIKTAAANEARFDHDGATGSSLGLLVEESRTNEILNSQVFTSGYNKSGLNTITQNTTVITPEGLTDGVGVITESSGGTVHQFYEASAAQITGIRTYSIFVKPNGRNYCVLMTSSFTHDLVNGTTLGSASGEFVSATTTKFPNGWVRCTLTQNHSNTYDQFNFKLAKDGLDDYSYSGDGTSGVYVWGAQLEAGSFPTSYIPTSGSTVTRSADVASISNAEMQNYISSAGVTCLMKTRWETWGANQEIHFNDGAGNLVVGQWRQNVLRWSGVVPSTTYVYQSNLVTVFSARDATTAIIGNDQGAYREAAATLSPGAGDFQFGIFFASQRKHHILKILYYPTRLTQSQLEALTL